MNTYTRVNDISFIYGKILKIIQSLDPNKARVHDGISVRMLKLLDHLSSGNFLLHFGNYLEFGTFISDWKKGNIVPVHNKIVIKLKITIVLYTCYLYAKKLSKNLLLTLIL